MLHSIYSRHLAALHVAVVMYRQVQPATAHIPQALDHVDNILLMLHTHDASLMPSHDVTQGKGHLYREDPHSAVPLIQLRQG